MAQEKQPKQLFTVANAPRRNRADVLVDINDFRRVTRTEPSLPVVERVNRGTKPPRFISRPQLSFVALIIICFLVSRMLTSRSMKEKLIDPPIGGVTQSLLPLAPDLPASSRAEIVPQVRGSETTAQILKRLGLDPAIMDRASGEISRLSIPLEEVLTRPAPFEIGLSSTGAVSDLRFHLKTGEELLLTVHRRGIDARVAQPEITSPDKVVLGTIQNSFAADAVRAGMSADLIDDFVDLFSDRLEFNRDLKRGDRFTIIFGNASESDKGRGVRGTILAAAVEANGVNHIAARYVGIDGKARYFDEKGELIGNTFLRYPLKFSRISSYYSDSRLHPVLQRRRPHLGVDFAAPVGTPIRAVASGRIVFAGYKGPNGNMVQIRHNDRYTTTYLHMSRISPGVTKGRAVGKGDILGGVGCTGLCTGPHLHFGFFDRGKYVDPLRLKLPTEELLRSGLAIGKTFLERVRFTIEHYQQLSPKSFS